MALLIWINEAFCSTSNESSGSQRTCLLIGRYLPMKLIFLMIMAANMLACERTQESGKPVHHSKKEIVVARDIMLDTSESISRENKKDMDKLHSVKPNAKAGLIQKSADRTDSIKKPSYPESQVAKTPNILHAEKSDQTAVSEVTAAPPNEIIQAIHDAFDKQLRRFVSVDGKVDYAKWKTERSQLDAYLLAMSEVKVESMDRSAQLAYWINLYNAATVALILDHFPLESVMDLDGGKTWDVDRVQVLKGKLSLNYIEHSIIRPQFEDARIHFAVNCAAKSCPPLANKAFTASNLHQLLEERTIDFINNKKYNDISSDQVLASRIFQWYKEDFGDNLIDYLNRYSMIRIESNAVIEFNAYDWRLNGK